MNELSSKLMGKIENDFEIELLHLIGLFIVAFIDIELFKVFVRIIL